jgi:hypothetical protein
VVQLTTKACLCSCCWGLPLRLRALQPFLILKSRELTLEMRSDSISCKKMITNFTAAHHNHRSSPDDCWWWITSIIYSWINMRNGINERIYIGLGFKLTNIMSFGESLFSVWLFQKTTKRDIFIKGEFRIKIRHIREKTLEDMRRHRNEAGDEGLPSGAGRPHL